MIEHNGIYLKRLENGDVKLFAHIEDELGKIIQLDMYLPFLETLLQDRIDSRRIAPDETSLFTAINLNKICKMLRDHCDYRFKEHEV